MYCLHDMYWFKIQELSYVNIHAFYDDIFRCERDHILCYIYI